MMAYVAGDEIDGAGPGSSLRYIGHSRSQGSELAVDMNSGELYAVDPLRSLPDRVHPLPPTPGRCRAGEPGSTGPRLASRRLLRWGRMIASRARARRRRRNDRTTQATPARPAPACQAHWRHRPIFCVDPGQTQAASFPDDNPCAQSRSPSPALFLVYAAACASLDRPRTPAAGKDPPAQCGLRRSPSTPAVRAPAPVSPAIGTAPGGQRSSRRSSARPDSGPAANAWRGRAACRGAPGVAWVRVRVRAGGTVRPIRACDAIAECSAWACR